MTDQQIIILYQQRDERAVSATSEKYHRTCMNIARKYLYTAEDVEECINEVMLKLWQSIPPSEPDNLEAFIVRLTKCTAINMAEQIHAKKRGGSAVTKSMDELTEDIPANDSVEETIRHRMLTKAVEQFLDSLSDDAQTIFVECYHNETKPREIAAKFGLSGIHVRKSLMQTRKKLKQYLTEEGLL